MRKKSLMMAVLMLGIIMFAQVAATQERDLFVGEVKVPSWRWGEQKVRMEIVNKSPLVKFIIAETELQYTGEYLNPNRQAQTCYAIAPGDTTWLEPILPVPGNYGRAKVTLRLFDVVDTMDVILPDQLTYEQNFLINFHLPEGMVPYFQYRIMVPPCAENSRQFDNEFSRVLFVLLNKGKTAGEIADMVMCDTSFVQKKIRDLTSRGYLRIDNDTYKLNFPVITTAEAEEGKQFATVVGDSLASVIAAQMGTFNKVRDSLIAEEKVPADSNTFYNGGTVLHYPYPVIGCLALWWDLGKEFISNGGPLAIFRKNDLCNVYTPSYMYVIQGGQSLTGTNLYAANSTHDSYRIYYGNKIPEIECEQNSNSRGSRRGRANWKYASGYNPKAFMMDSSIVRPAIDALVGSADELLATTSDSLQVIAASYGHDNLTRGYKYWFWNLVTSETMDNLVERNVIEHHGNGQFRFDGLEFKGIK
ncbi:MAG: hypothetical protein U9N55_02375 [candidate division Zixibacteria bacterium]|nr:hypothetical protein [candidate division Zixibacteria bacterium]